MLSEKLRGRLTRSRFTAFALIGASGSLIHLAVLWLVLQIAGDEAFLAGQSAATLVAMTSNFFLNNLITYWDRRLRGRKLLWGWLSFMAVCSIGGLANVGIANYLFDESHSGWFLSALAGILVGAVWNYALTAVSTWRAPEPCCAAPTPTGAGARLGAPAPTPDVRSVPPSDPE